MKVAKFETWWVRQDQCLFDEKRQGGSAMPRDVVVPRLTYDSGTEDIATAMAARSGQMTEGYLQKTAAPLILECNPHDREVIFYDPWNLDRHEAPYPVSLPGPVDVALWDVCARKAGLPLYKYIGGYKKSPPVHASNLFYDDPKVYIDEALRYRSMGINCYKVRPSGPAEKDMKIHRKLREAVRDDIGLVSDPMGEYALDEAIRVGHQLEKLNYIWFEGPLKDFELYKYQKLCQALGVPIATTKTTRGAHWDVVQSVTRSAADIVRADVSWKCGITGTLEIAHIADAFGLSCEIHTATISYMDLVNLHASCVTHNCKYFEYFVPEDSFHFPMRGDLPVKDGRIYVPKEPGIDAELDWNLIKDNCAAHRVRTLDQSFIE